MLLQICLKMICLSFLIINKFENYTQKDIVTIRGDLKVVDEHYAYYQSEISLNEAIVEMFYDIKE